MQIRNQWPSALISVSFSVFISALVLFFSLVFSVYASDKQWTAGGDAVSWEDKYNWDGIAIPSSSDDASIDVLSAAAGSSTCLASKTFYAKSIVVGGTRESTFKTADFVYGTVAPDKGADNALYIRKDGSVTLTGVGIITLKGAFKNSEEAVQSEPAFMFGAE